MNRRRRAGAAWAAGLAVAAAVAGCGGQSASPDTARPADPSLGAVTTAGDGVQEVALQTQDDFVFTPDGFTVAPGRVRLTITNVAKQTTHNFRFIAGAGPQEIREEIRIIPPGQSDTVEFSVDQPGEYGFECAFHARSRQFGTMTVSG